MPASSETLIYPRYIEQRVREALSDTRIVLTCGPRQSGKTTLARKIAGDRIPFFTLVCEHSIKLQTASDLRMNWIEPKSVQGESL